MKKDVKKMLAEHRADILPDERVKEKVKRDLGLSEVRESRLSYAQGGEHALTDKKKVFIAVVTVLLVAAIFLGVFLPLQLGGGTQPGGVPIIPDDPFGAITSADEFYAYGAASVGSILASSVEAQAGGAAKKPSPMRKARGRRSPSSGRNSAKMLSCPMSANFSASPTAPSSAPPSRSMHGVSAEKWMRMSEPPCLPRGQNRRTARKICRDIVCINS